MSQVLSSNVFDLLGDNENDDPQSLAASKPAAPKPKPEAKPEAKTGIFHSIDHPRLTP
jgi:hypothetical protein